MQETSPFSFNATAFDNPTTPIVNASPRDAANFATTDFMEGDKSFGQASDEFPQVYRHLTCGAETKLPENVLRNSQIDPCYYNGFTYCSSCNANWHQSDFKWVGTNENVHAYYKRMFREKSASYKTLYWLTSLPAMIGWGVLVGGIAGLIAGVGPEVGAGIGAGIGFVLGFGAAKDVRLAILKLFPALQ